MSEPSIIIAGDICLRGRTQDLSSCKLSQLVQSVKPIIQSADAALVNLETAVMQSSILAIAKAGPVIGTDARVLELIREVGFSGVTLANNHFADYGAEGVKESLLLLDEFKLWSVGAGLNASAAAQIKHLHVGDKNVVVINACEHEFTIASDEEPGCNALDPLKICIQITNAKKDADYAVVIIHGGHEHYNLPSPRMQELYRSFVDYGADVVVNHHQHCYSGYEIYKGSPIVYGLGNFFFDWPGQNSDWNEGYMVRFEFGQEIKMRLIPYIQNAESLGIRLMNEEEKKKFEMQQETLNVIIANKKQLQEHFFEWAKSREKDYIQILQPKKGKRIRQMERIHLLNEKNKELWMPEYMTEERRLLLKSLFQCESHQEIMNILLR